MSLALYRFGMFLGRSEGVARHVHLHDHGPSPEAFTFREAYDCTGARLRLDKARLAALRGR